MILSNLELYSMIQSEYSVAPQLQVCIADEGLDQMQAIELYFSLVIIIIIIMIIIMKKHMHVEQ